MSLYQLSCILCKIISIFHKDYPEKSTVASTLKNSALFIAKPTTKLATKILKAHTKKKRGMT